MYFHGLAVKILIPYTMEIRGVPKLGTQPSILILSQIMGLSVASK